MQLVYKPKPGFMGPGSGWPAGNHEEKNEKVAQAKLKSGFYREKGQQASKPGTTPPTSTKQDTKRGSAKKGDA